MESDVSFTCVAGTGDATEMGQPVFGSSGGNEMVKKKCYFFFLDFMSFLVLD